MIVDLSVLVDEDAPVYPGDPSVCIERQLTHDIDGVNDHLLHIGTHVGTHIDAPLHMIKNGKSLDEFSLEDMSGRGMLVDVRGGFDGEKILDLDLSDVDIVLFLTGMSAFYRSDPNKYFSEYSYIPVYIAQFLAENNLKAVGVDACSPDYPDYGVHKTLLEKDILIIENLTNLEELIDKQFIIYVAPLRLDIDGAPARVFAEVIDE